MVKKTRELKIFLVLVNLFFKLAKKLTLFTHGIKEKSESKFGKLQ